MATTRKRKRSDGSTAFNVIWRDRDGGKWASKTFDDPGSADMLARFLNDNDQCFRLAVEAAAVMRSTSPRVRDVVRNHIDGITSIESGTRARYRKLLANHIDEPLGSIPVDCLIRSQVLTWFKSIPIADITKKNIHSLLSSHLTDRVQLALDRIALANSDAMRRQAFLGGVVAARHDQALESVKPWASLGCSQMTWGLLEYGNRGSDF